MKKVELDANALKVATSRYFMEGEDWEDCTRRVADIISTAEETDRKGWKEKFHEMIYGRLFIPGGRILRNAGRVRGSLFNCYHLPIGDSIEDGAKYSIVDSPT